MVELIGLGLLLIGLALIVIELTYPGYYIGVAGSVGTIVGLLQMMWPGFLLTPASGLVAALVSVAAALVSFQFYRRFGSPINELGGSPSPELVGKTGVIVQPVRPHTTNGRVEIEGTMWGADAAEPIETGATVIVERIQPTHVFVTQLHVSPPNGTV